MNVYFRYLQRLTRCSLIHFMAFLATWCNGIWDIGSSFTKAVTSSLAACVVGTVAVIKTDTNAFVKVLCILITFISALATNYSILKAYLSSADHIVKAISANDTPVLANIVAIIALVLITWVSLPVIAVFTKLSTIVLPCATLLILGYKDESYAFYNSVMSFNQNSPIQAISSNTNRSSQIMEIE